MVDLCNGLNVKSPTVHVLKPNAQVDGIWRWGPLGGD